MVNDKKPKNMKASARLLFQIFLIINILVGSIYQVSGQRKVNITTGFGIPDLFNVGVCYQLDQVQVGLSFGTMPNENTISISGDVYYHYGGFSKLSDRRPWYFMIGVNYLRYETESIIDKNLHLNTRIGRDLNISKHLGLDIGLGAIFQIRHHKITKKPSDSWFDFDFEFPVLPSFGIGLFYKIE